MSEIVEAARRSAARPVNAVMTAAYWLIGRRVLPDSHITVNVDLTRFAGRVLAI